MTTRARTIVSRREALRGGAIAGVGLAAAALMGCRSSGGGTPASPAEPSGARSTDPLKKRLEELSAKYPGTFQDPPNMQPKRGGSLTRFITADIGTFDPTKSGANGNLGHTNTVLDTLLRRKMTTDDNAVRGNGNPAQELEGALAQSFPEVAPDGMTYVFRIRPGVKWQNVAPVSGRAFTAEDVKKAYERYATTGVFQNYFETVARMEVPDSNTLKITLKQPQPDFPIPLAEQNTGIFPMELVDKKTIDTTLIGTGPMMVKEVQKGQKVDYVRNPDYWGPAPYLDAHRITILLDAAAQLAAFRAEQVSNTGVKGLPELAALRGTNPKIQVTYRRAPKSTFHMAFNMDLPKWKDDRVRQAISLVIDRDTINNTLSGGLGTTLPNIPWTYIFKEEPTTPDILGKWWRYDLAEATKLLQAAGQEGLKFEYVYWNAYLGEGQNALIFDFFKKAGLNVTPQALDYVAFNSMLASVKYPDTIQAWDSHGQLGDNYFKNHFLKNSPGNWFHIDDPQVETWANQQSVELDPAKRREIQRKIWDRTQEKIWHVETMNEASFTCYQPFVHGISWIIGTEGGAGPFGYGNGNYIPKVWVEKSS